MEREPLKNKLIPAKWLKDYLRLRYVQEANPNFVGERNLIKAVELLRMRFKENYGSLYLLNHKENKVIDEIIKKCFPDLYPSKKGDIIHVFENKKYG